MPLPSEEEIKKLQQQRKLESGDAVGFGTAVSGFDEDIYGGSRTGFANEIMDEEEDGMDVDDRDDKYARASHPSTIAAYTKQKDLVSVCLHVLFDFCFIEFA
jgi:hypothetical protein